MISIRKRKLLESHMNDYSFFLLSGNSPIPRNGDVMYPFRQKSNILLLTGVESPDIVLTCVKHDGICQWTIFSDPLSSHEKLWGTERLSEAEISRISGIERILPNSEITSYIHSQIDEVHSIYTPQSTNNPYLEELSLSDLPFLDIGELLEPLRMIKDEEEREYIQRAIQVTHEAYERLRAAIRPGMYEYELEALVAGVFRSHHMTEAYPTIVASGPNACTLHYTKHTRRIETGDSILIDFGAEYRGYAADITRVFFVGTPSRRQREVYESVLMIKKYAESLLGPGVKKSHYESEVRAKMNEELMKLGLIPPDASEEEKEKFSRKYAPHSTSHFLGLDVHDVGSRETILESGMVVTCEPGIYIPEEGIGMRLEDDIYITGDGCENLSSEIPLIL